MSSVTIPDQSPEDPINVCHAIETSNSLSKFLEYSRQWTMNEKQVLTLKADNMGALLPWVDRVSFSPARIRSSIGPLAPHPGFEVGASSMASVYLRSVIRQTLRYLEEAYVVYSAPFDAKHDFPLAKHKHTGFVATHGSLHSAHPSTPARQISEFFYPNRETNLRLDTNVQWKVAHACTVPDPSTTSEPHETLCDSTPLNTFHQFGFGGRPTSRLELYKCFTSKRDALTAMHSNMRTTVVGHTPNPCGLPIVLREKDCGAEIVLSGWQNGDSGGDRFYINLDTQFSSDRGKEGPHAKNGSALLMYVDGSWRMSGTWLGRFEVYADSDDRFIGTRIKIPGAVPASGHGREAEYATPVFRVITKIKDLTKYDDSHDDDMCAMIGKHVCINISKPPPGSFQGKTTIAFVDFEDYAASRSGDSNPVVFAPQPAVIDTIKAEANVDVATNHGTEIQPMLDHVYTRDEHTAEHAPFQPNLPRWVVVGDVEGDPRYLCLVLEHAMELLYEGAEADRGYMPPSVVPTPADLAAVDFSKFPTYVDSGFDPAPGAVKSRSIRSCFHFAQMFLRFKQAFDAQALKLLCLGDCIGSPHSCCDVFDEFMCILCIDEAFGRDNVIRIAGNRELNKLRLVTEIPNAAKPENERLLLPLFLHEQHVREGDAEAAQASTALVKEVLATLCYPAVRTANKEGEHEWVSKHGRVKAVPKPGFVPVWQADQEKLESFLEKHGDQAGDQDEAMNASPGLLDMFVCNETLA